MSQINLTTEKGEKLLKVLLPLKYYIHIFFYWILLMFFVHASAYVILAYFVVSKVFITMLKKLFRQLFTILSVKIGKELYLKITCV